MPRVLVVDDDSVTRKVITLQLQMADYDIDTAPNGRIALEKLELSFAEDRPFDVMVLDIIMPEVTGWDVLEQLKQHPEWATVSVIVISGAVDWLQDLWYIDETADVYVEKRAGFLEDVLTVVNRVCAARESRWRPEPEGQ